MPCASQSKGADTSAPAAFPATSHTDEMTGTSHTSTIVLSFRVPRASDRLADVPEEVDESDRRTGDDRGTQADEDSELAASREVRVGRVRAQRPNDRRDDQREYGEDQADGHRGAD